MNSRLQRQRRFLLSWHRRIGAVISLLVIFISVTGILLNHTDDLSLVEKPIDSSLLLNHYGVSTPELKGFQIANNWLSYSAPNQLHINTEAQAFCPGNLLAATTFNPRPNADTSQGEILALCVNKILRLLPNGTLIEALGSEHGLPAGLQSLAVAQQQVFLRGNDDVFLAQLDSLQWQALDIDQTPAIKWPVAQNLPTEIATVLAGKTVRDDINLERLLLDLHSGRFFGRFGVYFADLIAIALCLLALSGLWIWSNEKWRRRQR